VAVTSTMMISTMLFYVVARERWKWSPLSAGVPAVVFIIVDIAFFSANISKIVHGAWFPLVIGFMVLMVMMTWKRGRAILAEQFKDLSIPFQELQARILAEDIERVKGRAVFMSGQSDSVPVALTHNLQHNKIIHSQVAFLNFAPVEVPRMPNEEKLKIDKLGSGFYKITVYYGYMENPSVPIALSLAQGQGLDFPLEDTSFFLGRVKLVREKHHLVSLWRAHLFAFLSRNSYDASSFYGIPQEQVMEVGVQLKI